MRRKPGTWPDSGARIPGLARKSCVASRRKRKHWGVVDSSRLRLHRRFPPEVRMLKGFRDFLMRGNVVELATAVIIGTAFSGVVDGLIKGIIDPLIAVFAPGEVKQLENALMLGPFKIGLVVSAIINFILKAAVVYVFIVKPFAKLSSRLVSAAPPPADVQLLTEIRDLLKEQRKSA
jgi:large conductance mechanosensitive channel